MGNNYILEAFKEFDLLEDTENEFPLDPAGMEDLSSFLDYAGEDDDNYVDVIDLEAEAEEELKQSYVGKVILDCNICHSHVFLDKDEIQIDDEGNVNIETECPYCMSTEGFNIIGEVKPYEDEAEEEEEPIEEEPEVEEEPIEESFKRKSSRRLNEEAEFIPGVSNAAELGQYYVDEVYGGAMMLPDDTIEEYFDYAEFGRELDSDDYADRYDEDELAQMYEDGDIESEDSVSAREYLGLSPDASDYDIGMAFASQVGLDGVEDKDCYFDYEAYGKDLAENGTFTPDGFMFNESLKKRNLKKRPLKEALDSRIVQYSADILDPENVDLCEEYIVDALLDAGLQVIGCSFQCSWKDEHDYEWNIQESLNKKSLKEGFWKHFEADDQYPEEWCFVQSEGSMSPECSIVKHGADSFEIRSSAGRHVANVDSLAAAQTKAAAVFDLGLAESVNKKSLKEGYLSHFDVLNWLGDHEQATADIENHYGKSLEEMNLDEILDWIYDHDQLSDDFEKYFGVGDVLYTPTSAKNYWDAMHDFDPVLKGYNGDFDTWYKDSVANGYIIESVIDVDTENGSTNIETAEELITVEENENGGISINTQPLDDPEEEYEAPDEVIAPLDLGDEAEIIDDAEATDFDDFDEEPIDEEPLEGEEFPADDFDEESFNELGESYLRKCYENVTSFNTTNVEFNDSQLVVEGVIGFDSGNKKKTSFRFNLKEAKNGKAYFTGLNEQISRGAKSFNLRCKIVDRKLQCEALRYNYKAQNELNESVKVYGTVRCNLTEAKKDLPIRKALQDANVLSTLDKDPKGTIKKAIEVVKASPDVSDKDKADFEKAMRGSQNKALSSLATYAFDVNKATIR